MPAIVEQAAYQIQRDCHRFSEGILQAYDAQSAKQVNRSPAETGRWLQRIQAHLSTLAACLQFSSPLLLADYRHWGKIVPGNYALFDDEIDKVYHLLIEIAGDKLPAESLEVVAAYLRHTSDLPGFDFAPLSLASKSPWQASYLEALLSFNRAEALRLSMEAVSAGVSVSDFYLEVIRFSQREIGRLWQAGMISVAQEHFCTAATQFVMSQLQPYFLSDAPTGKVFVGCCVGPELHEVGMRIVADMFEIKGWESLYLGANVPVDSVMTSLVNNHADVLGISTTMTQHLPQLAAMVEVIRSHPDGKEIKIIAGGYPFDVDPLLGHRVGVDAVATDPSEAISIADRFVAASTSRGSKIGPNKPQPPAERSFAAQAVTGDVDELSRINNEVINANRELQKVTMQLLRSNAEIEKKSKQLVEADRRKDELLATLAHELRGPLVPLSSAAALLNTPGIDAHIERESREVIKRQVRHMAHLINDLLDASRIIHGKFQLKKRRHSLSNVVKRALEISQGHIEQKEHQLVTDLTKDKIIIDGDEIRLAQVLSNLLTNAAKYTPRRGHIWLEVSADHAQATISVRDNGVGIEPSVLSQMFTPFTQVGESLQHSEGGLGLGLSVVKKIVELHGGSVEAFSGGRDQGSTFTVQLPIANIVKAPSWAPPVPTEISPKEVTSSTRRVLVVDDRQSIARVTARLLSVMGHQTEVAVDCDSALEQYQAFQPDVVLLDLFLPQISGTEIARRIRTLDVENRVLLVALTGHSGDEHREAAFAAGFDEYVVKPVDVSRLSQIMTQTKLCTG